MDPLSVLKTLWTHKWVAMPMVVLTVLACAYGMFWAPRSYESSATFALAMPSVPTERELENDPELVALNADNPYLRWNDTSLLAQVVIARVSSNDVAKELEGRGLSTDFTLVAPAGTTSGMLTITATDTSPENAANTVAFLAEAFTGVLREVQKVNNADDLYLVEAMPISGPTPPEEVFSSRLRSTAVLGVVGGLLLFGAVSLAQSVSESRRRGREAAAEAVVEDTTPEVTTPEPPPTTVEPGEDGGGGRRHAREAGGGVETQLRDFPPILDERGLPQPQHASR
ncbi:hypothetical protein [Citricoccus nitrophenolicus]|uniref:hypothetical protein n=1 Tax=Citricoccus nitrophenolicus TaxID=863575 RepID=UPI0031EDA89E